MIRLAHLSDIHVTSPTLEWQRDDWFNKRMAAWINFRWLGRRFRFRHANEVLSILVRELKERGVDHVVFSGDATALGFESEFKRAADILGVAEAPLLPGLAVPGNHDYCTRWAASSGVFERFFSPWQKGERLDGERYPFAQKVGPVWLVGVNTSTGNRWAWDAGGSAGSEQRERLRRLLAALEPAPRILVTHYPVCLENGARERRNHGLRDLDELVAVAAHGGVRLWIHGHRHDAYHLPTPVLAPFPVICAGSATQTGLWSYREYLVDAKTFHVLRRVFNSAERRFVDAESFDLHFWD
jgi:3',5'-cyclic AMP phosphodiesterase CpdA